MTIRKDNLNRLRKMVANDSRISVRPEGGGWVIGVWSDRDRVWREEPCGPYEREALKLALARVGVSLKDDCTIRLGDVDHCDYDGSAIAWLRENPHAPARTREAVERLLAGEARIDWTAEHDGCPQWAERTE